MLPFILYYGQLSMSLARLLGVRFIPGKGLQGSVGRMIGQVLVYHNRNRSDLRDYQLTALAMLASELLEIEGHDESLLRQLRNSYRKQRATYEGFRTEVAVASLLVRRQLYFKKTESPDFVVTSASNEELFIECGSARLKSGKSGDLSYKLTSAIARKALMPYVNNRTLLCVDVTNVVHHSLASGNPMGEPEMERAATEAMRESSLGATCLMYFLLDKGRKHFGHHFTIAENSEIDSALSEFLRACFPRGDAVVSDYIIPSAG